MAWTLVLHEDPLARDIAADLLAEELRQPVYAAGNLADARDLLDEYGRKGCRLIVSSVSPPVDADAPPPLDRSRSTAIELLKDVRRKSDGPPWLFLVSYDDGERSLDLRDVAHADMFDIRHMGRLLRPRARALLGGGDAVERRVDVDIDLVNGTYRWAMHGRGGTPLERSGVIALDSKDILELAEASRLGARANRAGIGQLGLGLYRNFLADPLKSRLELELRMVIGEALEAARFRFCVDEHTNDLLVEALAAPSDVVEDIRQAQLEHWMLRTPIFRKFGGNGERHPLFKDRVSRGNPVNCLILQGDSAPFDVLARLPGGEAVGRHYSPVGQAASEAQRLFDYFNANREQFGLAPPELMRPVPGDPHYGAAVRAKLKERPWQMIHYVGHSDISPRGTAYLALGGGKENLLEIDALATLASHAQFVFLSSCESSSAAFVMKLVARSVPAVLGYAWPIEDAAAIRFAETFYRELFDGEGARRFLEYAFMRSKRAMHQLDETSVAWAAPLLFMQMLGAEAEHAY